MNTPSLITAILIANKLEEAAVKYQAHVALGGSCLYKGYSQKDVDLFLYPHSKGSLTRETVFQILKTAGFEALKDNSFDECSDYCDKPFIQCEFNGYRVDIFLVTEFIFFKQLIPTL